MTIRMASRSSLVRASSLTAVLLVAAAARADVTAKSRTETQPEVKQTGVFSATARSSSGEANASAQPSLSAVTMKKGDDLPFQNGSNASFTDRARVVNGAGKSVRLSFAFGGMVMCSSDPGGVNPSTARIIGGVVGRGSEACMVQCSAGLPFKFDGCGGAAVQARLTDITIKTTTKIRLKPEDLKELGLDIETTFKPDDVDIPALAGVIANAIKLKGFNKFKIPPGTDVDIGFDVQFFQLLPPITMVVSSAASLVVPSVQAVAGAIDDSSANAEIKGSGALGRVLSPLFTGLPGLAAPAATGPDYLVLSATTKGPVPAGMKVVFEKSQTEVAVRAETACSDGIDNDGDGFTDFPGDRGCEDPFSPSENPAFPPVDFDKDLIFDGADNCPAVFNPLQEDKRGPNGPVPDGIGDACQ